MARLKNIAALALVLLLAGCDPMSPLTRLQYSSTLSRAEKGDAKAQEEVAELITRSCDKPACAFAGGGWLPPCDKQAAFKWYGLSAAQGIPKAQRAMGDIYNPHVLNYEGYAPKRDFAKALEWYRKAADQGDASSAASIAEAYAVGDDIERDDAEAAKWYLLAANKGSHDAEMSLAHIYMSGIGVEPDKKQALEWGVKAAQRGNTTHQRQLAKLYLESGDYAEAYYWSSLSWARSGGGGDEIVFTDLDKHLTPEQIAAIDARVKADVAKQGGK